MLTIVIQAGGQSRRMGQDKALLPFLGQPLIQRVVRRVRHLADEMLVTTNQPDGYKFLGLPLIPDRIPDRGALGGLYTALDSAHFPLVAVVACDMPFVSPQLLSAEIDRLSDLAIAAAIPRTAGGTEPFHAVYRREICLPAVEAAILADQWRVDAWYATAAIHFLDPAETRLSDPEGRAFWNVNTPEEFAEAEGIARDQEGKLSK